MGWGGLRNGELLALAELQFEIFITGDKRIHYQQNLTGKRLALIVLPSNRVPIVNAILPLIKAPIEQVQPGAYVELSLPASTRGQVLRSQFATLKKRGTRGEARGKGRVEDV